MNELNNNLCNLLRQLEKFSPQTYKHSINVANISILFGQKIGLSEKNIEKLKIASLFHDIGKLKIPDYILHKPAKLTKEEYEIIKKHPQYGVDLLINAGLTDAEILNLVLCHHERLDGLGYPKGLDADAISPLAKILTICDCYDAMHTKRIYQQKEKIDIKKEYENNSGTQFDPSYAKEFLLYLEEHQYIKNKKNR